MAHHATAVDILNPEITHRRLVSFVVEHADGSEEAVSGDGVAFVAGGNIDFTVDDATDDIVMSMDEQVGGENPYYRAKFDGLASLAQGIEVSGNAADAEHSAWEFTDDSLYITALGGAPPEPVTGAGFILGDVCNTLGEFEVTGNPGRPESVASTLSIMNICIPCLDCLSYRRIEEYLDRLRIFFDYIFSLSYDNATDTIPEHPDGGVQESHTGVLQQFMSSRRYWDFLVHTSTVKLGAQAMGHSVVAAGFYRNISDRTIGVAPNGVTMTFTFSFQKVDALGNVTPWAGVAASVADVEILDREGKCSSILGPAGVAFVGGSQVVVETISDDNVPSDDEIYSDVALVLMGTLLDNNPVFSYQVDVALGVSHTHHGDALDANPVSKDTLVFFRPPDEEESS
jgi:hypothetical protein